MKKIYILILLFVSFLLVGCTNNEGNEETETNATTEPTQLPTELPTEEPTEIPTEEKTTVVEENPYGELLIQDLNIYTGFPDVVFPSFTKEEYKSEITYTVLDSDVIKYENGYFSATAAAEATVEAKTQYHTTTFKVTSKVYTDHKGEGTANWYLSRIASVESKWINDGKPTGGTLFIGDSFFDTEFWSDFYRMYEGNVYTHGVSSSTTRDWEIFAKRLIYPVAPKNIVMHLGTNNLYDDGENIGKCYDNTVKLLEQIHQRLPETKVYYFAIEPRGYGFNGAAFNQTTYDFITALNNKMKTYCEANDYLVYVDATSYCYTSGSNVNLNFFRDQVHPKLENYPIYHNLLLEAGLELSVNASYLNTTEFNISKTGGIANTNTLIKIDGLNLTNNFSVSGKFKVTSTGSNPHIQFSFDTSNFNNRFLVWDNDSNGVFNLGYAVNGNHQANQGNTSIAVNEEVSWELVVSMKHAYFYINGELKFVFLNVNAKTFMIGAENTEVSFYEITAITSRHVSWDEVMTRFEIASYESSSDSGVKVIVK